MSPFRRCAGDRSQLLHLTSQAYPNRSTATFTPDAGDQTNFIVDTKDTNTVLTLG